MSKSMDEAMKGIKTVRKEQKEEEEKKHKWKSNIINDDEDALDIYAQC